MKRILLTLILLPHLSSALDRNQVLDELIGNFLYLMDTQVRCDGSYEGASYICNRDTPGERRLLGTWDSYIVPVAIDKTYPVRFVDSNIFVTTQTLTPLFFVQFDDPDMEALRTTAIYDAMTAINYFQRGNGFAFWPQIGPSQVGQNNRIGPLNLSPLLIGTQMQIIRATENLWHVKLFPERIRWMEENIDLDNSEIGFDVLFNVPNDADDTALAIASNYLFSEYAGMSWENSKYQIMGRRFSRFVDTFDARNDRRYKDYDNNCRSTMNDENSVAGKQALFADRQFLLDCSLDGSRERWRYDAYAATYSGAFLTWLYDENQPVYADSEAGVSLTGQNSVDCNAIANVLYSLALTKVSQESAEREAYSNSCTAVANSIIDEAGKLRLIGNPRSSDETLVAVWKSCGLFFPAHMSFPYMLSRAVGDADACQDLEHKEQLHFDSAMLTLLDEIIAEQDQVTKDKEAGQWYESIDQSIGLPTVQGAVSLLNFEKIYGDVLATDPRDLQRRVEDAIVHTIALSESKLSTQFGSTLSLPEGTFFGGGTVDEIAHWRSDAIATAISLELMTKYLVRYTDAETSSKVLNVSRDMELPRSGAHVERVLPEKYLQESLPPAVASRHEARTEIALRTGFRGPEAVIDVEYSLGNHLRADFQEAGEEVARYNFKVSAWGSYQFEKGEFDNFGVDLGFRGISTNTEFILQNDVAYVPITFARQYGVETRSIHVGKGELSAPLWKISNQTRINIDAAARALGFVDRSGYDSQEGNTRQSANLADFRVGATMIRRSLRASVWYESAVGYSEDSVGNDYFSLKNYSLGLRLAISLFERQSLSFTAVKRTDGASGDLFDDDLAFLQYAYRWN